MDKPLTATEILKRNRDMYNNPPVGSEVWRVREMVRLRQEQLFRPLINRAKELFNG